MARRFSVRFALSVFVLVLTAFSAEAAPVAKAEIGRDSWYTGDVSRGAHPYAVFFQGWNSVPREGTGKIVDYAWDFGDGSPVEHGFAAAHVFEKPGEYRVTLTVTDEDGWTGTDTLTVTVTDRPNPPLYFDAERGDDRNDGLSPQTAFRTGTKLRDLLTRSPGISARAVYLKRGGVYEWPADARPLTGVGGLLVADYGEGEKPVIRRKRDASDASLFNVTNGDFNRVVFRNIRFDGRTEPVPGTVTQRLTEGTTFVEATVQLEPGHGMTSGKFEISWGDGKFRHGLNGAVSGNTLVLTNGTGDPFPPSGTKALFARRGNIWDHSGRAFNLAFLDCDFVNHAQGLGVNRPGFEPGRLNAAHGIFVVGCLFEDSTNLHTFFRARYVALVGNTLRRAGNHGTYGAWMDGGVFRENRYTDNAPSRTCLRVSAAANRDDAFRYPSRNVSIRNNVFRGTHDGNQYTEYVVEIAPNTTTHPQSIEWVEFVGNRVEDGRTLLALGSCENVFVRDNEFLSPHDDGTYASRIGLGLRFNMRPCRNVFIENNTIVSGTKRKAAPGRTFGFFMGGLDNRPGPDGDTLHRNIVVKDNTVVFVPGGSVEQGLYFETTETQRAEIHTQNRWYTGDADTPVDRASQPVVGVGGTRFTLDEWARTGNERPEIPEERAEVPSDDIALEIRIPRRQWQALEEIVGKTLTP